MKIILKNSKKNGYQILSGNNLQSFLSSIIESSNNIKICTKTTEFGVFSFRSFLNICLLIENNKIAKKVRSLLVDITIHIYTYGNILDNKYINTYYNTKKYDIRDVIYYKFKRFIKFFSKKINEKNLLLANEYLDTIVKNNKDILLRLQEFDFRNKS